VAGEMAYMNWEAFYNILKWEAVARDGENLCFLQVCAEPRSKPEHF
jgi:hypothetical protein